MLSTPTKRTLNGHMQEVMRLASLINFNTAYDVTIHFNGHIQMLDVSITQRTVKTITVLLPRGKKDAKFTRFYLALITREQRQQTYYRFKLLQSAMREVYNEGKAENL